jgi:hypothetical protein
MGYQQANKGIAKPSQQAPFVTEQCSFEIVVIRGLNYNISIQINSTQLNRSGIAEL